MSFVSELRRRNVLRVLVAYAAGAWLTIEIMDVLTGVYEAPAWVMKLFVALVLSGILPVAIVSWFYELTPEGLRRDTLEDPVRRSGTGNTLNIAILAMLAAAFVIVLLFQGRFSVEVSGRVSPGPVESALPVDGPPIVAVLPFESSSIGEDSEFFASGIHDDLMTQLAKLGSLRVISRSSVQEFKGVERNIREIGRQLNADVILEGGVQAAGDRIRINAQLIDARNDEHLWAETYDRELSMADIFEVQSEIARAIAGALHASLSSEDEPKLKALPTDNMAAYRAYHEAVKQANSTALEYDVESYMQGLRQAVELDPEFTLAWSEIVGGLAYTFSFDQDPEKIGQAEEALARIAELAPGSVDHLKAQAYYTYYILNDYDLALGLLRKAQDMNPSNVELLELASWIQRRQSDWDGQIESLRKAWALDPRNDTWPLLLSSNLSFQHRYEEAQDVVSRYLDRRPEAQRSTLSEFMMEAQDQLYAIKDHRDPRRALAAIREITERYGDSADPNWLAGALDSVREHEQARRVLDGISEPSNPGGTGLSYGDRIRIFNAFFRGDRELLETVYRPKLQALEARLEYEGEFKMPFAYLNLALMRAANGQPEEALKLVRQWERATGHDTARRMTGLNEACQILGIAGLVSETVECLRSALSEPSQALGFLDPWLPYYDSISQSPEFMSLMAELEDRYGPMLNMSRA